MIIFKPLEEWWYKKRDTKLIKKGWKAIVPGVYYKDTIIKEYGISRSLYEKLLKEMPVSESTQKLLEVLSSSIIEKFITKKIKGNNGISIH